MNHPETEIIGGIEKRDIVLVDHDPRWAQRFAQHAAVIHEALGPAALQAEHIGSTSVPGLAAKPIVDILLVVADSAREDAYRPQLEAAGYVLRVREPAFHEHRMFRTPAKDVHLHVYSPDSPEIARYLLFRDRLRASAHDRRLYEATKRRLAARSWPHMDAYAEAKSAIVETIIARACAAPL